MILFQLYINGLHTTPIGIRIKWTSKKIDLRWTIFLTIGLKYATKASSTQTLSHCIIPGSGLLLLSSLFVLFKIIGQLEKTFFDALMKK
jgi:hypothetical protein